MNIISKYFINKLLVFPYIKISGPISRQTTLYVQSMLERLPKQTKKIGLVINSDSGSLSQAHIINKKLNILSKSKKFEIHTFIQDTAINAGFLLAMNGHKIYADHTSIIGGLEVNINKFILGNFVKTITYAKESSLISELNHSQSINPSKKQDIQRVFTVFSNQMQDKIKQIRKINQQVQLKNLFNGKQAKQIGLIDEIGRINSVVYSKFPQFQLKRLQQNLLQKFRNDLKKLDVW